jgi:hypothetical protein
MLEATNAHAVASIHEYPPTRKWRAIAARRVSFLFIFQAMRRREAINCHKLNLRAYRPLTLSS